MDKYIIEAADISDYCVESIEVNSRLRIIEARLLRKNGATPPIRAIVRFACVVVGMTVPLAACWTECAHNNVVYIVSAPAEMLVSTSLSDITAPILKIKKGGIHHVDFSVCHGN